MARLDSVSLLCVALAGLAAAAANPARAGAEEQLVTLDTRAGVTQKFILITPQKPVAAVILFAGGKGNLDLSGAADRPVLGWGKGNFLVRTRHDFAAHGFAVAVVEAPSDRKARRGMRGGFRNSAEHVTDIDAVTAHLKKTVRVPVWLIGTSRGTESAAYVAIHAKEEVAGVVFTSSMTEDNSDGRPVTDLALDRIRVPALIVAHEDDGCRVTPPEGAERIAKGLVNAPKVEVKMFSGGDEPRSKPCNAKSAHGFLGIEQDVVAAIAAFIKSASR
jgi:hypothetical protein